MLTVQYPGSQTPQLGGQPATTSTQGPNCSCAYDTMGRLNTMTDLITNTTIITGSTYDPANRLLSISGSSYNETRSYNVMGQLTGLTNNSVNLTYTYSSSQNNGKITGQTDNMSGEQVVYAYDALNRLASAAATGGSWGQSYAYDGFGNLTTQTVTAGTAPSLNVAYNASNNQQTTDCADANGNINAAGACFTTSEYYYDASNRIVSVPGGMQYSYAPGNKRIWKGLNSGSGMTTDVITFWSVTGQKLGDYNLTGDPTITYTPSNAPPLTAVLATANYYFGRKLIAKGGAYLGTDRLGSFGKYYPWGQVKPSGNVVGTEGFTGYFRDAETTLDYARNRYYQPGMGRFLTPDASRASGRANIPGSWNKYAYVLGDPIGYTDTGGREEFLADDSDDCPAGFYWDDWLEACEPDGDGGTYEAPPAPPCQDSLNQTYVNYVEQNAGAAYSVSAQVGGGVSGGFILAWAAVESNFGTSRIAQQNNNYFGEKFLVNCGPQGTTCVPNSNPNATAPWKGAVPCASIGSGNPGFACFTLSALGESALAALSTGHGKFLKAAINAGGSVAQMAQAIANAGWCKEGSCTNGGYGAAVQTDYNLLLPVLACLFPGMGLN